MGMILMFDTDGKPWGVSMSEDSILERAKEAVSFYDGGPASDLIHELIAEVEAKNDKIAQDAITTRILQNARDGFIKIFNEKDARIKELEAEVERLRSDWRQEHATAETWKEDCKKMQKRLTDSELLRQAQYNQISAKDARIKELEANQTTFYVVNSAYIKRLEAAFLEEKYSNLFDTEDYIEGEGYNSYDARLKQKAREALEMIKAETGSGDHVVGTNKLILTTEQREAIELGLGEIGTAAFRNRGVDEFKEKKLLAANAVLRDFLGKAGGKDED